MSNETFWKRVEAAAGETILLTEEDYYEALEVLPPIYLGRVAWFAVSEIHSHDRFGDPIYYCFARIGGKFYGVLATEWGAKQIFGEKVSIEQLYHDLTT